MEDDKMLEIWVDGVLRVTLWSKSNINVVFAEGQESHVEVKE